MRGSKVGNLQDWRLFAPGLLVTDSYASDLGNRGYCWATGVSDPQQLGRCISLMQPHGEKSYADIADIDHSWPYDKIQLYE